jgi:hypothetical protein
METIYRGPGIPEWKTFQEPRSKIVSASCKLGVPVLSVPTRNDIQKRDTSERIKPPRTVHQDVMTVISLLLPLMQWSLLIVFQLETRFTT